MKQLVRDQLSSIHSMDDQEREHGWSGVCNNQLVGGREETKTQQLCSEFEASSKPSTVDLAPKHNNQQHLPSFLIANEWRTK
jgi:hypothetical protein